VIRTFDVYAAQSCSDVTQADLLEGVLRWLTVLTTMAGEDGLYQQVPHLRVEGEGAAGLERRYTVFFKENAILVKREPLQAVAATFAEARNGLIVSDDGWFAVTDDGKLVRLDA
jgi:hypothetical protein